MRKLSTRSILLICLIIVSLSSYIYLNTVSIETNLPTSEELPQGAEAAPETEERELLLPDVQFIKKALETGKRFIPATRS